jgi:hypothetical protein
MDWLELFNNFSLLFFCFGMVQQQHAEQPDSKTSFNIAYTLALIHQRGIIIIGRKMFGKEALGRPCFFAFILMCMWAAFSRDIFMHLWVVLWLLHYIVRRAEAVRLTRTGQVHSYSDGSTINLGSNENAAKLVYEPVLVGILGGFLFWLYNENDWSPYGLPYYLLAGCFSLPFVEWVKQTIWERRVQSMTDARMEQEQLVRDYRDKLGN